MQYTRPLRLRTPLMRGNGVRAVQERLAVLGFGDSVWSGKPTAYSARIAELFQNARTRGLDGFESRLLALAIQPVLKEIKARAARLN